MAVGDCLYNLPAKPFPEFHHPFLVTGRAEMPPLAREGQKVFMAAFTTFHPRKAIVQDTAVEIAVDHMPHRRTEKTVLFDKTVVIDLLQFFKMILNTLIILRVLWFSRAVYRRDVRHGLISPGRGQKHI
jgi:hypothetical protein